MKDKILTFFKNLTKLEWVTAFFLSGAVWMLIGLIVVLLTAAPEVGAIIMVIGLGMLLIAVPLIFACSLQRALRKAATEEELPEGEAPEEEIPTEEAPKEEAPKEEAPKPTEATVAIPAVPKMPAPAPAAVEQTVAIPAVKPQAAKPKVGYLYLMDELEMQGHTTRTEADLKGQNGMTVVMARDKEGYALQIVRALGGKVETERFSLPANYFETNTKNDFRIRLFKQGIFRVDVDLLWSDPAFRAMIRARD
ncbi:MAG: hypothetical protein IJN82_05935 [Clostridia bacterium]|nr:hypothetical protein [Clostridia bacterium]